MYISTNICATTESTRLARTMSRDADSAPRFSAPRTAADVLSHLHTLALSNPTVLQQQLVPRLEAPEGDKSEEALRQFIETVDSMLADVRALELYLKRLSQVAGEELDTFSPKEVGCATYFAVQAKQDAEYRESLPLALADLERFLPPQPQAAAKEADEEVCSTVGGVFGELQRMLNANPDFRKLRLDKDEPVDDKLLMPELRDQNEMLMACHRLCATMSLKMGREAEKCRYKEDDLRNPNFVYVADDLERMRNPRALLHETEMRSLREGILTSKQMRKRQRCGEK